MQGTLQKAVVMGIALAMITTAILPNRQTSSVLGATERLSTGTLSTAMGTSSGSIG